MDGKRFQDLDLKNAFLFAAALEDPETCRMILEMILGRGISKVNVHVEHSILYSRDFRSIRMDVYAADEMQVSYNMEMQNGDKKQLPKRSRLHQAEMDVSALKPGQDFQDLKPCYVIFICTFDPFDHGLYRYTFEERCKERDFPLGDEACRIFLNTKGTNPEEVSPLLVNFLHYVEDSSDAYVEQTKDQDIERLHDKICALKKSREWEAKYVTFGEYIDQQSEELAEQKVAQMEARIKEQVTEQVTDQVTKQVTEQVTEQVTKQVTEQVMEETEDRFIELVRKMLASGEVDKIPEFAKDKDLLKQMYKKYNL